MESAKDIEGTHYTAFVTNFNVTVGNIQTGYQAVGDYDMGPRNSGEGELLVELEERNTLPIMNNFCKREVWKWTSKSQNAETKNKIRLLLSGIKARCSAR